MLPYERQSRSVNFFQPLLQEVGPFGKKERGTKEESRRVQGSTERGKTKMYYQHTHISYHMCARAQTQAHTHASTHTASRIFRTPSFAWHAVVFFSMEVTFLFHIFPSLYLIHGCSYYQPFWKPPSQRLERGSRPGKRDEGEGLHFRRNVVLELESE